MKPIKDYTIVLLIGLLILVMISSCKQKPQQISGYKPDVSISVNDSNNSHISVNQSDSIICDLYRGVNVKTGKPEPIYIDTTENIWHTTEVVNVNNTSHWVVTDDNTSNSHQAIIGIFIKRVKIRDWGADNQ